VAPKSGFDLIQLPLESWTIVHADHHKRQFVRDVYGDDFSSRMIVVHQTEPLEGVDLTDLEGIRQLVQNIATQAKQIMVSAEVIEAAGLPSLWYILKQSQAPSGMAYSGSLVLPLADQFFTIQLMCLETGITGIRESIVVDKLLEQGVSFKVLADNNSYCESGTALAPYSADAEIYDERFPNHPLTRVRRYIAEILAALSVQKLVSLLLIGIAVTLLLLAAAPPAVRAAVRDEIELQKRLDAAEKLAGSGKPDKSIAALQLILNSHPHCARALFLMGNAHQDRSIFNVEDNQAKEYYLKALAIDPNYSHPCRKLAELAGYEGNFNEQVRLATRALAGQPPDRLAYRVRAIGYSNLHKDQDALKDIRKFFEFTPTPNRKDEILKATFEQNANCDKEAVASFERLLKVSPDGDLLVAEAKSLVKLGKSDQALQKLENYLKPGYDFPPALSERISICVSLGKFNEALKDCDYLIKAEPSAHAYLLRASVWDKMGQKAKGDDDRRRSKNL
jgi:tetratricopeptide (TPR) repeat protein